jgi:protoporphyrin/coproporphyrin ferrochelatase
MNMISNNQQTETRKHGVMLVNMGGPSSKEEIPDYLYRLFSDPLIIGAPSFIRRPLARFIASRRKVKSATRYDLIGGKSPLKDETAAQARTLETALNMPVTFAMRYTEPFIQEAHQELEKRGVNRLIVLPLYPQYSHATTMSALNDFLEQRNEAVPYRFIQQHHDFPAYIIALRQMLNQGIQNADPTLKTMILFVAHSIPIKQVKNGDPYVDHVRETVALIAKEGQLEFPHSLSFQSRIGPVKWQGPTLNQSLKQLRADGVEQLIVQPVSFVSENLETLYDLDIEFKEESLKSGIKKYIRVPTPGIQASYIEALAALVNQEIGEGGG